MFKKILAFLAAMSLVAAYAAVDVNKGSEAELDSIKGIGPAKSKQIVAERKKGEFKSWEDLISRVKGLGEASAAKLSAEGLTVGGASYKGAAAPSKDAKPAAAAKADAKAEAKAAMTKVEEKADAKATMAKADAKADAKAAMAKADAKPAAAAKPEAKAEAAKK